MKKVYFASDFHLGVPTHEDSLVRERRIIAWLEQIRPTAEAIYLVGDIFDFWFEWKRAVPRGFVRLLGKLAEMRDEGIPIYAFTGNHDIWMFGYFEEELGIPVYRDPQRLEFGGKRFLVHHGDGIGPGDRGYKFIKSVFSNRICQWLFARLHPNFGIGLALFWSQKSREADIDESFKGEDEWQVMYARDLLKTEEVDYFVFGHRHIPSDYPLNEKSRMINLGDWINHFTYAVFDGNDISIEHFKG